MPLQVDQLRWMAAEHGDEPAYTQLAAGATLTFADWDPVQPRGPRPGGRGCRSGRPGAAAPRRRPPPAVDRELRGHPQGRGGGGAVQRPAHRPRAGRHRRRRRAGGGHHVDRPGPGRHRCVRGSPSYAGDARGRRHATWDALTGHADDPFQVQAGDGDLADIMYTSGTTGRAKGVAVRHRNTHMIANGDKPWTGAPWIHCSPLSTFAGMSFIYNPMKMGMRGLYLPRFDVGAWIDSSRRSDPRPPSWCRPWCSCCWPTSAPATPTSPA